MQAPETSESSPTGPGCLMVAAILIGTVMGLRNHQATIGLLAGIGSAVLIMVLAWAWDRMR